MLLIQWHALIDFLLSAIHHLGEVLYYLFGPVEFLDLILLLP